MNLATLRPKAQPHSTELETPHPPLRALLVEGSRVARDLLHEMLQSSFTRPVTVQEFRTPREVPPILRPTDLVLVDIDLDPEGACSVLRRAGPGAWRLATTLYDDEDRLLPALRSGIHGYLLKQDRVERQIESLQRTVLGLPEITPAMARCLLEHLRLEQLGSDTMTQVLTSLGRGASVRETARSLNRSVPEIEHLVAEVYRTAGRSRRDTPQVDSLQRRWTE